MGAEAEQKRYRDRIGYELSQNVEENGAVLQRSRRSRPSLQNEAWLEYGLGHTRVHMKRK